MSNQSLSSGKTILLLAVFILSVIGLKDLIEPKIVYYMDGRDTLVQWKKRLFSEDQVTRLRWGNNGSNQGWGYWQKGRDKILYFIIVMPEYPNDADDGYSPD